MSENPPKPELQNDYPAGIYSDEPHRPPEYVAYLDHAMKAMHALKLVVFGVLAVSLIVAAYGFFLIYQLTRDSHRMVEHIGKMSEEIVEMRRSMLSITNDVAAMTSAIGQVRDQMGEMNRSVGAMNASVAHLAGSVGAIQHSTANLDRSFGPAMGMLNNVMPFGWGGNSWRGAPAYAPPPPIAPSYPQPQPWAAQPAAPSQPAPTAPAN